ncbi:hypothetical protein, conserved [Babesia bigemina]|uniref:C3H1-type domain-containing protein n=1 Tax=Babesia bigemina TaxID=5866 RepID=A0A061BPG2_BABBI|nr:hypothetical protein, conserved [Babesia bigemina]CDR71400.1 hypothetical protein, conserved [Babesia bigemina]|eukprot:XP_012770350.1 hypothetical protein, conserved [Babesia bigemina]
MGFLSGVLEAVKDENEVTTYDKNDDNNINTVISKVNKNIGTGREGLAESVGAVKGWLEGYGKKLDEKINEVKNPINEIKNKIEEHMKEIENEKSDPLFRQIARWTQRAGDYHARVVRSSNALINVDSTLNGKLSSNIEMLKQATQTFEEAAKNDDLNVLYDLAGTKWTEVTEFISSQFQHYSASLQKHLKREIGELHDKQRNFRNCQFSELFSSINIEMLNAFNTVQRGIDDLLSKHNSVFVPQVEQIKQKAKDLQELVVKEKGILKAQVRDLGAQMDELRGTGAAVLDIVPNNGVEDFEKGDKGDWDLKKFIQSLKGTIVKEMKQHVGNEILHTIQGFTSIIKGTDSDNSGLVGIKTKIVEQYASGFKTNFKDVVKGWIEDILDNNIVVRKYIQQHFKENLAATSTNIIDPGTNYIETQHAGNIAGAIVEQLKQLGVKMVDAKVGGGKGDVQKCIDAVFTCISDFVNDLKKQLNNVKIDYASTADEFVDKIVTAIEDKIVVNPKDARIKFNMKRAVHSILSALQSAASQALDDLENLAGYEEYDVSGNMKVGDNVDKTLSAVEGLYVSLKEAMDEANGTSQNEDHGLVSKVKTMDKKVSERAVNDKLKDLIQEATKKGITELQKKVNVIVSGSLDGVVNSEFTVLKPTLTKIRNTLAKLRNEVERADKSTGLPKGESTLNQQANELHSTIEAFLRVNVGQGDDPAVGSLYKDMQSLQSSIKNLGDQVNKVMEKVENVQSELASCITKAEHLLSEAPKDIEKCFKGLNIAVTKKIDAVFEEIQQKSKDLYTARKTQEVTALQKIVDDQFTDIKQIIDADKDLGLKGYLSKLHEQFMPPLSSFTQPASRAHLPEKKLSDFAPVVKNSFHDFLQNLQSQGDLTILHVTFGDILKALETFLTPLTHFNHSFTTQLERLTEEVERFRHLLLANTAQRVSLSLVPGLRDFVKELEKAYVSVYDGHPDRIDFDNLVKKTGQIVDLSGPARWITVSTPDGTKLAKILLTIFNFIYEDLDKLNNKCDGPWRESHICEMDGDNDNRLGQFMKRCGYKVAGNKDSKEGELNFPSRNFTGKNIHTNLNATKFGDGHVIAQHLSKCESNEEDEEGEKVKKHNFDFFDLLNCLLSHVNEYNEVCYLSTLQARRQPCSVYEMLVWLSGLPHHPVYTDMKDLTTLGIIDGLNKNREEELSVSFVDNSSLEAYPDKITYNSVQGAVTEVCSKAYDTVVCIAGTGDAQTVYGCDYSNNSFNFYYPQDGEGCLDMLLDVLRRLFPPLKFLRNQCKYRSNHLGWRDCQYGMDVPTGKSQCTEHSRDQVTDQPKCRPTCQASSKVSCQPNSPLMSYLNDCLPGHLPHHLTKIGCRYECATCPSTSKKGMPCMTPLGFRGFSGSIKTGKDICAILDSFFSIRKVETLFTLLPKPPSSLPEHFGFALSLVGGWYEYSNEAKNAVQKAFEDSIKTVSIQLVDKPNELTDAITNAYGSGYAKHNNCLHNHVKNLTTGDICKYDTANVDCAPYMSSLCADSYYYVAKAHSDTYLSWAVYLPWNFWTLLSNLYQDFCNIMCQDWGCRNCLNSRQCKRGQHGLTEKVDKKPEIPHCKCDSMVKCKGVAPTFYRYGFSFGNVIALNAGTKKRLCSDFCTLLDNILKSKYFADLFDKCDEFLFKIRAPFIWLNVALWLLSLLYLLHIMVIRLDLLHIKSHLHSPSSHRIAAQSLLAAARVNKLNRVFYLQP